MTIDPFRMADIQLFLVLAAAENWVAEPWEFEFLLSEFPQGCFAARGEKGETVGFITSLRHDRSAWIGNLIVAADCRGKGIGQALFRTTFEALVESGVETVWLTASKAGMPLYQKYGFRRIDTIIRWVGSGRQNLVVSDTEATCRDVELLLSDMDCQGWGDRRADLLKATAARGKILQHESAFAVLQPCGDARQIGPFSAQNYSSADALLKKALQSVPSGTKICLDAPASNRSALRLFNRRRMRISGSNELMYAGVKPDYRPEQIFGLATMGSCG